MDEGDHCVLWSRSGILYLHSEVGTRDGLYTWWPPFLAVPERTSDALLGRLITLALRESKLEGPEPPTPKNTLEIGPLHRLANVKSWREFERGARHISITRQEESFTLRPWHQRPRGHGYTGTDKDRQAFSASISESELAGHARKAFPLCTVRDDA